MNAHDWIIHWHRRYYGPSTIAPLVSMTVSAVQEVIYKWEESWKSRLK